MKRRMDGKRACGHTPHCSGILSRIILTVVTLTSKLGDKTLVSRGSRLLLLVASRFVLIMDVRERDRRGRGGNGALRFLQMHGYGLDGA